MTKKSRPPIPAASAKLPDAVWKAALAGEGESVEKYLLEGGDVNAVDPQGRTLLMNASNDGRGELVRLLLRSGADADKQDPAGWTALHFAAQGFHPEVLEALIDHGCTIDLQDAYGNTPLWRATFTSRGRGEIIGLLRRAGADPDRKNRSNVSPKELAFRIANYDVKQFYG